jgi:hypothetical protein
MWRRFWFRAERQAGGAEVQSAGCPVPMPEEQGSRLDQTPPTEDEAGEAAAFLARVYTHQQC